MDWEKVLSRLSVPGITLLLVGAVLCVQATRLCRFVLHDRGERAVLPVRIAGLVLALLGALILQTISNGMTLLSVQSYWQMVIKGIVLILAVLIDVMRSKKR